jgi:hypothetical protein
LRLPHSVLSEGGLSLFILNSTDYEKNYYIDIYRGREEAARERKIEIIRDMYFPLDKFMFFCM